MDPSLRFRLNYPKVVYEDFDEELILINFDSGNYYSVNKTGVDVWHLLGHGASVDEIAEWVAQRYDCDSTATRDAIVRFVTELQQEDLILPDEAREPEYAGGPAGAAAPAAGAAASFEPPTLHRYSDMQELLLLDPIHEVDETGWPNMGPDTPEE